MACLCAECCRRNPVVLSGAQIQALDTGAGQDAAIVVLKVGIALGAGALAAWLFGKLLMPKKDLVP